MVAAFEEQNKCKITWSVSLAQHKGYLDLMWTVQATSASSREVEPYSLALASVSVWGGDYKTLMAVHTRLLYALDFQLALKEYDSAAPKKA